MTFYKFCDYLGVEINQIIKVEPNVYYITLLKFNNTVIIYDNHNIYIRNYILDTVIIIKPSDYESVIKKICCRKMFNYIYDYLAVYLTKIVRNLGFILLTLDKFGEIVMKTKKDSLIKKDLWLFLFYVINKYNIYKLKLDPY